MLELNGIKKSFDGTAVLNDISLEIGDSQIVSILGSSGGGKTTLLNIILGLLQPDSGSVVFNGNDITNTPMERRGFNIVFQDYALFPNLTAYKNIVYGLRNYPDRSTKEEIEALIDLLDLRGHLNKKIDQLSGGQKQRVALARTMVMKPKILLLDEPLSGVDVEGMSLLMDMLDEIRKKFDLSILMTTHDFTMLEQYCDQVVLLQGKILRRGTPLRHRSRSCGRPRTRSRSRPPRGP